MSDFNCIHVAYSSLKKIWIQYINQCFYRLIDHYIYTTSGDCLYQEDNHALDCLLNIFIKEINDYPICY